MTATKQTELLPCPCCGHPKIEDDESYIMCQNCGLMIDRCDAPNNDYVAAWNTRAQYAPEPTKNPYFDNRVQAEMLEARSTPEPVQPCQWVRDEDNETYETACGSTWHYTDGGYPGEHGQLYCHHCGNTINDEVDGHV